DFKPAKDWQEPKPKLVDEKDLKIKFGIYEEKAVLENKMAVAKEAAPGEKKVKIKLVTQVCDEKGCIPVSETLEVPVTISAKAAVETPPSGGRNVSASIPAPGPTATGLRAFLLQGVAWGAISLLTPCVFPMIPITVSFFIKQSEREKHNALALAAVYSGTIVAVLTIGAVTLLKSFQNLSQWWGTNLVLGALFLVFA